MANAKPIRLLIAALGGEGGGVLAGWIADAAVSAGCHGQRTSIPGVAQRTGATTYYLEILPRSGEDRQPVLALNPAPGEVDVLVASEMLEAVRAVQQGLVSPDRTLLIASHSRVFTVDEKSAMGDGRLDPEKMEKTARAFAKTALIADFAAVAAREKAPLNSVILGALAASSALPVPAEKFRAAIRAGKSVDANLRGFEAGLKLADGMKIAAPEIINAAPPADADNLEERARKLVPTVAAEIAVEGVRRLNDFQGPAYAGLYLERLMPFVAKGDGALVRELARHLAVRMSFEDTIRVAQLKLREGRVARLRDESRAKDRDLIVVSEFLKPGPEEILSMLPPRLGRALLRLVHKFGWSEASFPMKVRTTRFGGFLRLKLLSKLRSWRPRTLRYAEEQAWAERWLSLVDRALQMNAEAAREVVETARLVKGYGDTYKRGMTNWNRIAAEVIEPHLQGGFPPAQFADAVLQARLAALADPDGARLGSVIDSLRNMAAPRIAAE
jgi:indolepyruvate ferredoxin oxidoreductase, beta subunit